MRKDCGAYGSYRDLTHNGFGVRSDPPGTQVLSRRVNPELTSVLINLGIFGEKQLVPKMGPTSRMHVFMLYSVNAEYWKECLDKVLSGIH